MSLVVHVINDVLHIIKIVFICEVFLAFEKRNKIIHKVLKTLSLVCMSIVSTIIFFLEDETIVLLTYILAIILLFIVLFKEKIRRLIISSVWIITITAMLDKMTVVLIELIFKLINYYNRNLMEFMASLMSLVLVVFVGKLYTKIYPEAIKTIGLKNIFLFTLLAIADTFVVMVMAVIEISDRFKIQTVLNTIAFIIVIIGIFIQLGAVILLFIQRNVYKEKEQLTERYLNEQIAHYEYLETRETETKKFRHDIRSHMQMLSNLARKEEYDKIDEYINEMDIKFESFGNMVTVQNGIVDAVVNQYYSKAIRDGIYIDIRGSFPKECCIDAYDLCTIFSNVLSNAYEATIKAQDKRIILECRYNEKKIIFTVTNTYKNEGQFERNKFITSKEDIDYHGYGVINIRESVEKYNGVLDIEITNNEFSVTISLYYKEKRYYENSSNR